MQVSNVDIMDLVEQSNTIPQSIYKEYLTLFIPRVAQLCHLNFFLIFALMGTPL